MWRIWGVGLLAAMCIVVFVVNAHTAGGSPSRADAAMYLSRGSFVVGCGALPGAAPDSGLEFMQSSTRLGELPAWTEGDLAALGAWIQGEGRRGLVLGTGRCDEPSGVGVDALREYRTTWPFVGRYFDEGQSYYELSRRQMIDERIGLTLAEVARAMLSGEARAPRLDSFPDSLRTIGSTEMMVLIREGSRARLWRSARGRSRAQALLTAVSYARSRWTERESAMGGALRTMIDDLHVEVIELIHHGVIVSSDTAFIDRVVVEGFGVGYEQAGRWRYVLPRATASAGGGAAALRGLLQDNGLNWHDLDRPDVRAYRIRAVQVGVSAPIGGAGSLHD